MNKTEEHFYAIAAQEIASKHIFPGVMAKALVDADGDEKKTILNYIRLRVSQLKEEYDAELLRQSTEAARQAAQRSAAKSTFSTTVLHWSYGGPERWGVITDKKSITFVNINNSDEIILNPSYAGIMIHFNDGGWSHRNIVIQRPGVSELVFSADPQTVAVVKKYWKECSI